MDKKLQTNNEQSLPSENPDDSSSDQIKFTMKQRLSRLFMVTERKDKLLIPQLIPIKDAMHENFCHTWSWKSSYINDMFRLYAHKDQDITVSKPQLALFSKYLMSVPGIDTSEPIRITQYLKTLRFIRAWLDPLLQECTSFVKDAKNHAIQELKNDDEAFTVFDNEVDAEAKNVLAKKYLHKTMSEQEYDRDRFMAEKNIISDCVEKNNYHDLMTFAFLWFHYFEHKHEVYEAFTPEQLQTLQISFTLPGFHPTILSLWAFLKIIEQLDFKKHIFSV